MKVQKEEMKAQKEEISSLNGKKELIFVDRLEDLEITIQKKDENYSIVYTENERIFSPSEQRINKLLNQNRKLANQVKELKNTIAVIKEETKEMHTHEQIVLLKMEQQISSLKKENENLKMKIAYPHLKNEVRKYSVLTAESESEDQEKVNEKEE
jgi:predicted RNase H-like nuclease (RuvC/YqgF family)